MTENPQHKSLIIIGGGAMGVGLLYHLAHQGWTDTLLIEKGELFVIPFGQVRLARFIVVGKERTHCGFYLARSGFVHALCP